MGEKMLHRVYVLTPLMAVLALLLGCEDTPVSENADQLQPLYSTSFEVPPDTAGWVIIGGTITTEGSPFGGARSFRQYGGDVIAGSYKELPPVGEDSTYFIQFYGRVLKSGGRGIVILAPERPSPIPAIRVNFDDTTWGYHTGTGSFPPGTNIQLHCVGLGIGNSALMDEIRVYTVKE